MNRQRWIILAVFAAAVAVATPFIGVLGQTVLVNLLLAATVATGVALLMGFAGQVSLGQGAFFAVGALTAALMAREGVAPFLAVVAGAAAAAALAFVVGIPLLRLRGHYLAFGTLAMQIILLVVVNNVDLFGGPYGIQGIPLFSIFGWELRTPADYSYLALAVLIIVLLISQLVVDSRFGRGLRALAGSESAAQSSGISVSWYKTQVFTLTAAFAGLAGAVYPFAIGHVSGASFPLMASFQYVVMAVVGGMTSVWGGVIGAFAITILVQALNGLSTAPGMPPTAPAILGYAVYAIALIAAILLIPRGIGPTIMDAVRRRQKSPPGADSAGTVVEKEPAVSGAHAGTS